MSAPGSAFEKISVPMITLIALFRSIPVEPKQPKRKEKHESTDPVQKNTNSTTSHRTCARCVRALGAGYTAAREHSRTVEHDRREHGRRLRSVPGRGLHLHGLHLGCSV